MITCEKLTQRPQAARSLIGMSLSEFDELYAEFAIAHAERQMAQTRTKRGQQRRQRAVGAGGKHKHSLKNRLMMTLFWLRAYMTYEVLGFFYELDKTNIEDNLKDVLATLDEMTSFNYDHPKGKKPKLNSVSAVMDAFPDVRLVIDAKEQRIQRPKNTRDKDGNLQDKQRPYYSGKKKAHTLKNQFAVAPDGFIEHVSDSVPGGANHDLILLRQTDLLSQLSDDEAAMLDKGYEGIQNDFPDKQIYQPYKARRNKPLTEEQKAYNRFLSGYRIVVEHALAQVNRFEVLRQVYRHDREKHTQVVRIVSGLVNRRIQSVPLKSYAVA